MDEMEKRTTLRFLQQSVEKSIKSHANIAVSNAMTEFEKALQDKFDNFTSDCIEIMNEYRGKMQTEMNQAAADIIVGMADDVQTYLEQDLSSNNVSVMLRIG